MTDSTPYKMVIQTTDKVVAIGSNLTSATHRRSKHEWHTRAPIPPPRSGFARGRSVPPDRPHSSKSKVHRPMRLVGQSVLSRAQSDRCKSFGMPSATSPYTKTVHKVSVQLARVLCIRRGLHPLYHEQMDTPGVIDHFAEEKTSKFPIRILLTCTSDANYQKITPGHPITPSNTSPEPFASRQLKRRGCRQNGQISFTRIR
jgi:hypothetical protein